MIENFMQSAVKFQNHTLVLMNKFNLYDVIDTDQTGCQYQTTYDKTLSKVVTKTVLVKK